MHETELEDAVTEVDEEVEAETERTSKRGEDEVQPKEEDHVNAIGHKESTCLESIVLRNDMLTSFLNMHGEETRNPRSESSHSPWKIVQTSRQRTRGVGRENVNKPIAIPRVSSSPNKLIDNQPNPSYNFHMLQAEEHEVVTKASTDASSWALARSRHSDVAREGET
nr:hypothetical protein CFP56_43261 [Quercus suber]